MQNSIQNIEEKLIAAQQYLEKGEIEQCFNLCQKIEKEINSRKANISSTASILFFEITNKEILKRLNQLMIKSLRQEIINNNE